MSMQAGEGTLTASRAYHVPIAYGDLERELIRPLTYKSEESCYDTYRLCRWMMEISH